MNNHRIKVTSNWSHVGGCTITQCIQEIATDPDIFIKPDINNLVDEKKSILLSKDQLSEHCELYINKYPDYKIQAVSFVCNVVKVEIFQGPIMEYMETVYGGVVDETDDQFKSYRYDIEIEKSGVTDLTLRFLTSSSEVCMFGLILHTSPNPNGRTLLPFSRLTAQNASQTEAKTDTDCNTIQNNSLSPLSLQFIEKLSIANDEEPDIRNQRIKEDIIDHLKFHIDKRFEEFSIHVNNKLAEMEKRQNKKLDKLLHILENK